MKTKTNLTAGAITSNHNQGQSTGLPVKTRLKVGYTKQKPDGTAGGQVATTFNHNETRVVEVPFETRVKCVVLVAINPAWPSTRKMR